MKIVGQSIQFDAECKHCEAVTKHIDGQCQKCGTQNREGETITIGVNLSLELSVPDLIVLVNKLLEVKEGVEKMRHPGPGITRWKIDPADTPDAELISALEQMAKTPSSPG